VTRFTPILSLAIASCALAGCVALWGSAYHVESVSATGATIRYDAVLIDSRDVVAHANEICGQYQKVAVPKAQRLGVVIPGGSIAEITFACDTPAEAAQEARSPLVDGTFVYSPPPALPPVFAAPASYPQPPQLSQPPAPPPPTLMLQAGPADLLPPPKPPGSCIGLVHVPFNTASPCP